VSVLGVMLNPQVHCENSVEFRSVKAGDAHNNQFDLNVKLRTI
jgi:hypothetical protein